MNRILVLVHGTERPSNHDWNAVVSETRRLGCPPVLVYTLGGGPDANQRRDMADALGDKLHRSKTAVLTPSKVVRGIVTAIGWITGSGRIKFFAQDQYTEALEHLDVDWAMEGRVRVMVESLLRRVSQ